MAQLRLALAQINPVVGDLDGNAAQVLRWARHAADQGCSPHRVPRDGPHRLSRRGPRAAPVFPVDASRAALTEVAAALAADGLGDLARRRRLSSTGPDAAATLGIPAARRRTPPPSCTTAGSSRATPSTTCPTTASSTSSATSCPGIVTDGRRGCTASTSRSPSARTSGRTAARSPQCATPRRRAAARASTGRRTSATRTTYALELVQRRAAEAGCTLAYVNMVGGQDELVFDGDSLVVTAAGRGARSRAAVRRRSAGRRPRPARCRRTGPTRRADARSSG